MRRSHGLEYRLSDNGAAVLCGIGSCESDFIYVPESVDGYTVVGVTEKAFCRCEQIKGVVLPSSVRSIGAQAFAWCRNLESIVLDGAVEIKDRASFKMKGKYGKNKKPIGVWNIKLSEEGHTITMTYDEKGNLQKYGYRDESTGDWHEVMPTSNGRPEWMYTDFLRHIQYKYLLRSTKL